MSSGGKIGRPFVVIIIAALVSMSIVTSLLVYTTQQTTEARMEVIASRMLRDDLEREAKHVSSGISTMLSNIEQTLSGSALAVAGMDPKSEPVRQVLRQTQSEIDRYTDSLIWILADGRLEFVSREDLSHMIGSDFSQERFYELSFVTRTSVMTTSLTGIDGTQSFVVAVPVTVSPANGEFNGVLAAFLSTDSIANAFLKDHVLDQPIIITSNTGTILVHPTESLVGHRITDEEIFRFISTETRDVAQRNFELMMQGRAGTFEYRDQHGTKILMSYEPVFIGGSHLWTAAAFKPTSTILNPLQDVFTDSQALTFIATGLVWTVSAVFIIFILVLNQRLLATVYKQEKKIGNQLAELQTAYDRLKEQDIIKDEFINIAAHELRTPVLPIVLSAESLLDNMPENENLKIIMRNAKRITKLTNDILDVSRIESNTFRLQKQKTNICQFIEEVINDVAYKIPSHRKLDIKVESSLNPEMEELSFDRNRLNQVLLNLLDNAINFTDEGTIKVTIESDSNNRVRVSVIDEGKGIDPKVKENLFGKFVSKSDKAKGTGLGLYVSKAIIEAHGGTISGENNANGRGATFSFTLPIE